MNANKDTAPPHPSVTKFSSNDELDRVAHFDRKKHGLLVCADGCLHSAHITLSSNYWGVCRTDHLHRTSYCCGCNRCAPHTIIVWTVLFKLSYFLQAAYDAFTSLSSLHASPCHKHQLHKSFSLSQALAAEDRSTSAHSHASNLRPQNCTCMWLPL